MQNRQLLVAALLALCACGPAVGLRLDSATQALQAAYDAADPNWTWIPTPGTACGNGDETGFGASLVPESRELFVFFEGGGACRNFIECFVLKTAVNLMSGYQQADFEEELDDLKKGWFVTNRNEPKNPFRAMNMAYIPYCTGDLHAGHNVMTYRKNRTVHHVGGDNAALYLQHLAQTLPNLERIVLSGYSAGGFAALLNREATAEAFPGVRIDVMEDSGMAFADAPPTPASWKVTPSPAGCDKCDQDLSLRHIFVARQHPEARVGVMSFSTDTVLPLFYGITNEQYREDMSVYTRVLDGLQFPNLKYFIVRGKGHVVLNDETSSTDGLSVAQWVSDMAQDAPAWRSVKPSGF